MSALAKACPVDITDEKPLTNLEKRSSLLREEWNDWQSAREKTAQYNNNVKPGFLSAFVRSKITKSDDAWRKYIQQRRDYLLHCRARFHTQIQEYGSTYHQVLAYESITVADSVRQQRLNSLIERMWDQFTCPHTRETFLSFYTELHTEFEKELRDAQGGNN